MRKTLSLVLAMVMLVSVLALPAMASEPKMSTATPSLSFSGNTATCTLRCSANYATDELVATIRLYRGNTLVATWNKEANGYLFFSGTANALSGYTYRMEVDLTINGANFSVPDVTKTCP